MTNGEKLKEIFPNIEIVAIVPNKIVVIKKLDGDASYTRNSFLYDWWNAEYKEPTTKNDSSVLDKNSKKLEKDFGELDCISRQAVLELIADDDLSMGQVVRGIHALPPVTPQEPRKGHWIELDYWLGSYRLQCSKCEQIFVIGDEIPRNYCPNCGADMREVKE